MVMNQGVADFLPSMEVKKLSLICQCQVLTCVKQFLTQKMLEDMVKQILHHSNY